MSGDDVVYYHMFKCFPERNIDHVEIDVFFEAVPESGPGITLETPVNIPAWRWCQTYGKLLKTTKKHWPAVFRQIVTNPNYWYL